MLVCTVVALWGCGDPAPTTPSPTTVAASSATPERGAMVRVAEPPKDAPELDPCGALVGGNDSCGPITTVDPWMPGDVCAPDLDWQPSQSAMDHLSWRTLMALLWPAKAGARGEPDVSLRPGAKGEDGLHLRTVFETWPTLEEIDARAAGLEPGEAVEPEDWSTPIPDDPGMTVLRHTNKIRPETAHALGGRIGGTHGGPVIDQLGHPLLVETRFNRAVWDVITGGRYYRGGAIPRGVDFPNNLADTAYGEGAIAVQAAWSISEPGAGPAANTLSRTVLVTQDGNEHREGTSDERVANLVSLAIAHKTAMGGDRWVWSVFDHDSVAPEPGAAKPEAYLLWSEACAEAALEGCEAASAPAGDQHRCCPNTDLHGVRGPKTRLYDQLAPTQLVRLQELGDPSFCGRAYGAAFPNSPLPNFRLVGTQWWPEGAWEPLPDSIRSLPLQPWAVEWDEDAQRIDSSCIGCHDSGDDSLFLLSSRWRREAESASPSGEPSAPE